MPIVGLMSGTPGTVQVGVDGVSILVEVGLFLPGVMAQLWMVGTWMGNSLLLGQYADGVSLMMCPCKHSVPSSLVMQRMVPMIFMVVLAPDLGNPF